MSANSVVNNQVLFAGYIANMNTLHATHLANIMDMCTVDFTNKIYMLVIVLANQDLMNGQPKHVVNPLSKRTNRTLSEGGLVERVVR